MSNPVTRTEGNAELNYGGGSTQAVCVKSNTVDWDDWE